MMKFSLCMIVKNEEMQLRRCLESVKDIFDEIIIVDTGSVDSTKRIALEYTDKLYEYEWCDDFAAARNFSFSKAVCDYIMWLDADDVLEEKDRIALAELKERLDFETNVVMMKYAVSFSDDGTPLFYYYRERLVKRLANLKWNGFVHEVITPSGKVLYEDITVCHKPSAGKRKDPQRNLKIYESKLAKGVKLGTREMYYYARELYYNGKYDRASAQFEKFILQPGAWYVDKTGACIMLYRIYERSNPEKAREKLAAALAYKKVTPEVLCLMGDSMLNSGNTEQAVFWYSSALLCPVSYRENGFIMPEYERYYPLLQLCVCYDKMGDYEKARECNRLAGIEKPECSIVKQNEDYFSRIYGETEKTEENLGDKL